MKKNTEYAGMKAELRGIAFLRATLISHYTTLIMLVLMFTYGSVSGKPVIAPLYILLATAVLPAACGAFFYNSRQKISVKYYFPVLCKKYSYTIYKKQNYSNASLAVYILFIAWIKSPSEVLVSNSLENVPAKMLISILILRIISYIFYYIILKKQLLNPSESD